MSPTTSHFTIPTPQACAPSYPHSIRATVHCSYCNKRTTTLYPSSTRAYNLPPDLETLLHKPSVHPKCTNRKCWGKGLRVLVAVKIEEKVLRCWACETPQSVGLWEMNQGACREIECGWKREGEGGECWWMERKGWAWPREKKGKKRVAFVGGDEVQMGSAEGEDEIREDGVDKRNLIL